MKASIPLAICLALLTAAPAGAAPLTGGTWGKAKDLPGLAALNAGGEAQRSDLSCASAGNCTIDGYYTDSSRHLQAFVDTETNGTWGTAQEVPGTAALNVGGFGGAGGLSCASPGNCSMGGSYVDGSQQFQGFVDTETDGTWGTAEEVPGLAALNVLGNASTGAVQCGSPGNCSADGTYTDESDHVQGFVVNERNGVWGTAKEVPGLGALNTGGYANTDGLSCTSVGNCVLGGSYSPTSDQYEPFLATEKNGSWGMAKQVPGIAHLNVGNNGSIMSLSCASAGNCAAGGQYVDGSGVTQAFTVDEAGGTWGQAKPVPGLAALNTNGAYITSISCAPAGDCAAVGNYGSEMFVVNETSGTWGKAEEIPGTAGVNTGDAFASEVSCGAAGNCSATGWYVATGDQDVAFVVSETGGVWGNAEQVQGLTGGSNGEVIACTSANHCTTAGDYDGSGGGQPYAATEK